MVLKSASENQRDKRFHKPLPPSFLIPKVSRFLYLSVKGKNDEKCSWSREQLANLNSFHSQRDFTKSNKVPVQNYTRQCNVLSSEYRDKLILVLEIQIRKEKGERKIYQVLPKNSPSCTTKIWMKVRFLKQWTRSRRRRCPSLSSANAVSLRWW